MGATLEQTVSTLGLPSAFLVLPTYNEAVNIQFIIQMLTGLLDKAGLPESELIVVEVFHTTTFHST
jgi:hypothetical protein